MEGIGLPSGKLAGRAAALGSLYTVILTFLRTCEAPGRKDRMWGYSGYLRIFIQGSGAHSRLPEQATLR